MKTPSKVVLVNPRICRPDNARLPLSLLSLAAVLDGRYPYEIIDGNVNDRAVPDAVAAAADAALLAVTVMPGPQVGPAIEVSAAARARYAGLPIVWGGYFPTLYPDSAINAPYVDYLVRGQGEASLLTLLERLADAGASRSNAPGELAASAENPGVLRDVPGLTYKQCGQIVHNPDQPLRPPESFPAWPYHRLNDIRRYLRPSFMGSRTAVHQAAVGCRYRCNFCGVVSMFNGHTKLSPPGRLELALRTLRDELGANAVQFYDHNFFDREESSIPLLEVLARMAMPWWCYARADALADFSDSTWQLVRRSQLKMAYIGAESASDQVLRSMKKGAAVEQTLQAARRCREHGVIPEFSFVLGGPSDPEGEIERTFEFIRQLKKIHPQCEVILYFYSPTPQRDAAMRGADASPPRLPVLKQYGPDGPALPTTPEEWTLPRWLDYVCHQDAPWLTDRLRQRVRDFTRVLACRFPTVQDYRTPRWGKAVLRALAAWRYSSGAYAHAWELDLARRVIPLRQPQRDGL